VLAARGAGLFLGLELVSDERAKEPLPQYVTERIFKECLLRCLLTKACTASFRIQPSVTIDEATALNGLAILREAQSFSYGSFLTP
jgi:4-aminobutyrate aminotransferase-like enzyme